MSEYNKLINDINGRNFLPIYLLHGDENYFSDQIIKLLLSNVINKDSADFDDFLLIFRSQKVNIPHNLNNESFHLKIKSRIIA